MYPYVARALCADVDRGNKTRLKVLQESIVPYCIAQTPRLLNERRLTFALACRWAVDGILNVKGESDSMMASNVAVSIWHRNIIAILVNAPEIVMSDMISRSHPIMMGLGLFAESESPDVRRAAERALNHIKKWITRSAGSRCTSIQVEILYESIQAFYLAMRLHLRPKWIESLDAKGSNQEMTPQRAQSVPRAHTEMARFMMRVFPMAVVAPVLASVRSTLLRAVLVNTIKRNLQRYGHYISPLVAVCVSFVGWMTPKLASCVVKNTCERGISRADSFQDRNLHFDALVASLSAQNSLFWSSIRSRQDVFCCLTSRMAQKRLRWAQRCGGEWRVYEWLKAYSVMSVDAPEKEVVLDSIVNNLMCPKLWGMYEMLKIERATRKAGRAPATSLLSPALKTADSILSANQWDGVKSPAWTVTYTSAVERLALCAKRVCTEQFDLQNAILSVIPKKEVVGIVIQYSRDSRRRSVFALMNQCLRVSTFMHLNAFDYRFNRAQRVLLESVIRFVPSNSQACLLFSNVELRELRALLGNPCVADQMIRCLMHTF